jgi:hypothetical protein
VTRLRVETRFSKMYFNAADPDQVRRAYDIYAAEGIRICICEDFEVVEVVDGLPLDVQFSKTQAIIQ